MLTLLARGGLPGLRVGLEHARGALLDGGETRGLACCDAGRSRLASAVAVAGAAVPPSRSCQVPAPSAPRRRHSTAACEPSSAVRRSRPRPARCAAARPARAQLVDAGRSGAWRLLRSPRHRAGAALAGQRVGSELPASHRAPSTRSNRGRVLLLVAPPRPRGHVATTPKRTRFPAGALQRHARLPMQRVVLRYPAGAAISGRAGNASTLLSRVDAVALGCPTGVVGVW
jgi:hypothetical protein